MRHKGERSDRQVDRDYPHQVEIAVPPGGLGVRLNEMHDACRGIDYATRGIGRKRIETGRDAVRFCSNSAEAADAFHPGFGGERVAGAERSGGRRLILAGGPSRCAIGRLSDCRGTSHILPASPPSTPSSPLESLCRCLLRPTCFSSIFGRRAPDQPPQLHRLTPQSSL
jgi:hypothetical protein